MNEHAARLKALGDAFDADLKALLAKHSEHVQPWFDALGEQCEHAVSDTCECKPKPNLLPVEWVLVTQFQDMDSSDAYSTLRCQPGMLRSHIYGLLATYVDEL